MRLALLIVSIVFSILLAVLPGHAQNRVALVIGNSAYRNASPLPNTQNDATDIAASFQRLGFSVKTLHNATFDDMRRALLQFGRDARGSDMAVVYFAGHGMEVGGENWLIPVDAELRSDRDVENEAISLKSAMLQVANAMSLGLVILDSCRDNPFAAQMQRVSRTRAVDRGLARVEPTDNVLVAYAAKDGTVASDGRGRNSPFTAALLNNLEKAGVEIRFLLATVRDEVLAATNRQQQPFVYGSLSPQPIYLKPPAQPPSVAAAPAPSPAQPLTEVERAWAAVQASPSIAAMEAFVRRFGDSFYADLARVRIEELKRSQTAVAPQTESAAPRLTPPVAAAPQNASPTGGPCGSRAVASIDPCPSTQQAPNAPIPRVQPAPTTQGDPVAQSRRGWLLARLAAYSVPPGEREALANRIEREPAHKAIAVSTENHTTYVTAGWATGPAAEIGALEGCQMVHGKPCALVAVDDQVEAAKDGPPILRDMPRTRYAGLFEPDQIPRARPELLRRADVTNYRSASEPKAAAFHHQGSLFIVIGGSGQFETEERALSQCNDDPSRIGGKGSGGPCFLYAVGNQVVLPQRSVKPLTPRRTDAPPSLQAAIPPPVAGSPPSLHDRLLARFAALSVAAGEAEVRARDYEADKDHKAIAVGPRAHLTWRGSQWGDDDAAVTATLEKCQVRYGEPCTLVAVGDKIEPASVSGPPVLRDMQRVRYEGVFEPEQIPGANGDLRRRADVASYRSALGPKAAAYHPNGGRLFIVRGTGQFESEELALKQCNDDPDRKGRDGPCFLYAVGDQVVLPQRSLKPLTQPRTEPPQSQPGALHPQATNSSSFHDQLKSRLAALSVAARDDDNVRRYELGRDHRALVVSPTKHFTYWVGDAPTDNEAMTWALEGCQVSNEEPCTLVAVNDKVERTPDDSPVARDMARPRYAGRFEPERVPAGDAALLRRTDVTAYRSAVGPKAAAFYQLGSARLFIVTGAASQFEAEEQALTQCNNDRARVGGNACFLYAAGHRVVLAQRLTKPRPKPETIREAFDYWGMGHAYLNDKGHKAIAAAPERGSTYRVYGAASVEVAEQRALEGCQLEYRTRCVLLARDDELRAPDVWKAERHDMPRLNYKGKYAPSNVPLFSGTEDRLRSYAALSAPKAMAIRPNGSHVNIATGASLTEAQSKALAACNEDLDPSPCFVYAVNERVILDQRRTEPLK